MNREAGWGRTAATGCADARPGIGVLMLAALLAGCLVGSGAGAAAQPRTNAAGSGAPSNKASPYVAKLPDSARTYYAVQWGVDQLSAKLAESGQLVRFNYRVTDAAKAAPLNDKVSTPYMLDEKSHAVLQIPEMEKVGKLRQSGTPESGKSYWMVFSNKGSPVKPGHRVSVVIGQVRIDGLVVQ